ncbi:hypothetical protein Taro_033332 [Colocasia esculenta]|uniref:Uncharacterized protein n=1 Tax=Colocasia esculenta TaxID=4460 RepID=A0A843W6P2_COLES|nr:hypothetical protein [Colocasia esculenta]
MTTSGNFGGGRKGTFCKAILGVIGDSFMEEGVNNENMQWVSGFLDGQEGLDQSSEHWLASCFNENEIHFSSDEMYALFKVSI